MVRIKTPGIITFSEYRQAKIASQFTIAEAIVCCYCQEPVEINRCGNENLLDCEQHGTMRLEVSDYTFYLHRINGRLLDKNYSPFEVHNLVEHQGCPFCRGCLKMGDTHTYETHPENQVFRYPLDCSQCEISFYVVDHHGVLRFQPKPEHFHPDFQHNIESPNDIETTSPQGHPEDVWHQTYAPEETKTADTVKVSETTPTESAQPAINVVDNDSETKAEDPANKRKYVRKQILRVLHINGIPMRRSEIQANANGNVVKPLRKLVKDGLVIQPKRGYYSLP